MADRRHFPRLVVVAAVLLLSAGCTPEVAEGSSFVHNFLWPAAELLIPAALLAFIMVMVGRTGFRLLPAGRPLAPRLRPPAAIIGVGFMLFTAVAAVALTVDWPPELGQPGQDGKRPFLGDSEETFWSVACIVALGVLFLAMGYLTLRDALPHRWRWLGAKKPHGLQAPSDGPPTEQIGRGEVRSIALGGIGLIAVLGVPWPQVLWGSLVPALIALCGILLFVPMIRLVRHRSPFMWTPVGAATGGFIAALLRFDDNNQLNNDRDVVLIATLSFLGLVGTVLYGWAEASRISIQIDVWNGEGDADAAAAAQCVERVLKLGRASPEASGPPRASNVVGLPEDALMQMPNGYMAIIANYLVRLLVRPMTWKAEVTVTSVDQATVTTRYLGSVIGQQSVRLSGLGWTKQAAAVEAAAASGKSDHAAGTEEKSHSQVIDAAAAFVFTMLTTRHREFRPGLCGAESWESIAAHTLAQELEQNRQTDKQQVALRLMQRATSLDPDNRLAASAYYLLRFGNPTDKQMQIQLVDRLGKLYKHIVERQQDAGFEALKLQLLFNTAALNYYLARRMQIDDDEDTTGRDAMARKVVLDLVDLMRKYDHEDPTGDPRRDKYRDPACQQQLCRFVRYIKPDVTYLVKLIVARSTFEHRESDDQRVGELEGLGWKRDTRPWGVNAHLYRAAYQAERLPDTSAPHVYEEVFSELALVVGDPEKRMWIAHSPSFMKLRKHSTFHDMMAWDEPRRGFLDLKLFDAHRRLLDRVGVTGARDLQQVLSKPEWHENLATRERLPSALITDWKAFVDLHDVVQAWTRDHSVPVVGMLLDLGVRRPADIPEPGARRTTMLEELELMAADRAAPCPKEDQLVEWRATARQ
jgi:hypothetical protein